MNFIWIGSHAPENQTRLFLLFESEFFGENMVLRPTSSSAVTTATIHLPIQIWLFLFIPPDNLPPHKKWRGVKNFHFQLCFTFLDNCIGISHEQPTVYNLTVFSLSILGRNWIKNDRIWKIKRNAIRIEKAPVVQSSQAKSIYLKYVTLLCYLHFSVKYWQYSSM